MNCKPGDLAVTRGVNQNNSGKIVRCMKFVGPHTYGDGVTEDCVWLCDALGQTFIDQIGQEFSNEVFIGDSSLRPIRDQDGEDETLTWAGKPKVREQA